MFDNSSVDTTILYIHGHYYYPCSLGLYRTYLFESLQMASTLVMAMIISTLLEPVDLPRSGKVLN